jgi:hypothetical protein
MCEEDEAYSEAGPEPTFFKQGFLIFKQGFLIFGDLVLRSLAVESLLAKSDCFAAKG